jgi:MFS family permease
MPNPPTKSGLPSSQSGGRLSRYPHNVWVLSWISFFNDAATEISYWLLPQFLVGIVGAGPVAFGLIEGAAETAASLGRLVSGIISDRLARRKPLVAWGYTVANLSKPLLAFCTSWHQIFWLRFTDRASKGLRGAPRDALLADSIPAARLGEAFGLRQAMDSAGAILGPLSALVLLKAVHGRVRVVFWMAGIPGLAAVLLSWLAVHEVRPSPLHKARPRILRSLRGLDSGLLGIFIATSLFALGNSSDLFLILRAENLGVRPILAPLLGMIFNTVYATLSWPLGRLSDRVPPGRLVASGWVLYGAVYAAFGWASHPVLAWMLFPIYGVYYALTEGILKAWIASLAPSATRGSVFGLFTWMTGLMAFPASLLAGWLWQKISPAAPFYASAGISLLAAMVLLLAGNRRVQV